MYFLLWETTPPCCISLLKKTYYSDKFLTNDIITSLGSIIKNYLNYKEHLVKECLIYKIILILMIIKLKSEVAENLK